MLINNHRNTKSGINFNYTYKETKTTFHKLTLILPSESVYGSQFFVAKLLQVLKNRQTITINVPVVYMGRYKVVLWGDYP